MRAPWLLCFRAKKCNLLPKNALQLLSDSKKTELRLTRWSRSRWEGRVQGFRARNERLLWQCRCGPVYVFSNHPLPTRPVNHVRAPSVLLYAAFQHRLSRKKSTAALRSSHLPVARSRAAACRAGMKIFGKGRGNFFRVPIRVPSFA